MSKLAIEDRTGVSGNNTSSLVHERERERNKMVRKLEGGCFFNGEKKRGIQDEVIRKERGLWVYHFFFLLCLLFVTRLLLYIL